uniref:Uncharacterized protein n=1 Tax=Anguilla anguilla TaxID=7936 RepID=A0A0E9U2J1_ANGAN
MVLKGLVLSGSVQFFQKHKCSVFALEKILFHTPFSSNCDNIVM